VLVPWVDDSRCKAGGQCRARLAYSMRATGIRPAAIIPATDPVAA
jgi:hypothetical protein